MQITKEEFRKYLVVVQGIEGNTIRTYLNRFDIFQRWLLEKNRELNRESVADFLYEKRDKLGLTNNSVNTYRNTLVHLDKFCKYHNLPFGFTEGTRNLPKIKADIVFLEGDEPEKLISVRLNFSNRNGVDCSELDEMYLTMTHFFLLTGCRYDEGASLKIKHLDIDNGKALLLKTKNKERRNVFFEGEPLKNALKKLVGNRGEDELVFVSSTGEKVLPGSFNEILRLRAEKAGLSKAPRMHAHVLRHTFATQLINVGVDVTIVSKLMGHKDIRVTYDTYVHLTDPTLKNAVNKHPLLRQYIDASDIIEDFKKMVDTFSFTKDKRFDFQLLQSSNGIELKLLLT